MCEHIRYEPRLRAKLKIFRMLVTIRVLWRAEDARHAQRYALVGREIQVAPWGEHVAGIVRLRTRADVNRQKRHKVR